MRKALYSWLCLGALLAFASGCSGDDDDDSGSSTPDPASVAKCYDLFDVYCPGIVDCLVSGGSIPESEHDATEDDCTKAAKDALDCTQALGVSASYDDCVTALTSPDCDAVNTAYADKDRSKLLPSVCSGVIFVP